MKSEDILRLIVDYGSIEAIVEKHPGLRVEDIQDTINDTIEKSDMFRAGYYIGYMKNPHLLTRDLIKTLKLWKRDGGADWIGLVLESDVIIDFLFKLEAEGIV